MSEFSALAWRLIEICEEKRVKVAVAESCTGGMVAAAITDMPGSAAALDRGFVTYSNEAKIELLGVPAEVIAAHGAVSRETAEAMARGALAHARAAATVAITGIAGPTGGGEGKPVGLVWFASARTDGSLETRERRWGDIGRAAIRKAATLEALEMLVEGVKACQATGGGAP